MWMEVRVGIRVCLAEEAFSVMCGVRFLGGFAHCYGHATNTIAECRAFLDGLRLCQQLGLRDVLVELDSSVVVGWFILRSCTY